MDFLSLIREGRVEEFKSRYSNKVDGNMMDVIISSIPEKYLDWVGKTIDNENIKKVSDALSQFEKIGSNLKITNIYDYKSVSQLFDALEEYKVGPKREFKEVQGGNVIYDDERYFVVNPLTYQSSCYYGKGTKWCTSADSDNQFEKYNKDGKLFYILDKTLDSNDPFYKVSLLKKFDGDESYFDAKNNTIKSGWIFNTDTYKKIVGLISEYMSIQYKEELKIYTDKELAKKEKEKNERLKIQRILNQNREEAQTRRENNEWGLDNNCPPEGLRAHALLTWLLAEHNIKEMTKDDIVEIQRLKNEIERLDNEFDNSEDSRIDLLDEKEELESELESLEQRMDVYNIIPDDEFYDMNKFIIIDNDDIGDSEYAVGIESEMESSCYNAVDSLIDDIGYEGFSDNFVNDYIDEDEVISTAEEIFQRDIYDSPESYFDESQREISREQDKKIDRLEDNILQTKNLIERIESESDGDDNSEQIDELNEKVIEIEDEIQEIRDDPEGDFPEDLIDDMIKSRVNDVKDDVVRFLSEYGLNVRDYVNTREFIQGVIDADGYGHTLNSYDGSTDEIYFNNTLYYILKVG